MTHRKLSCLFLIVLALTLAVGPLHAQAVLTQTIDLTADGLTLSLSYPQAWVAETADQEIMVASSAGALTDLKTKGVVTTAGDVGIAVYLPGMLKQLNLPENTAPEQTISAYLSMAQLKGTVENNTTFTVPAATATITNEKFNVVGLIGALAMPDGTVIFGVVPSSAANATTQAILSSITLQGPADIPQVTPDVSVSLTPTSFDVKQPLQTYTLSVGLPDGWITQYQESGGLLYLGNSDAALKKASAPDVTFEPGEIAISLALPGAMRGLGIAPDTEPDEAISHFQTQTKAVGKVVSDDTFSVPAAHAALTGGNLPDGGGDVYALKFGHDLLFVVVQPSGSIDGSLMALLQSIRFAPADEATAPALPTLRPTIVPSATTKPAAAAQEIRQWASYADGTSEYGADDWSFMQAVGKPNTPDCGDSGTAWASKESTERAVLRVGFAQPVIASQINIYQSYTPGAIVAVDVGNSLHPDKVLPLPNSADPVGHTDCPGVFSLDVSGVTVPIDFVVIYLDQSLTGDWNEIDAVQLVGAPAS